MRLIKQTKSLWPCVEPLLKDVERPVRYLNHELNAVFHDTCEKPCESAANAAVSLDAAASLDTATSLDAAASLDVATSPDAAVNSNLTTVDIAFVYPDTYEVGQPNQAIAILYDIANALPGVNAERAFLPWIDMINALRSQNIPLFSLESCRDLAAFDIIGITIPHELSYTNILEILNLAGISLYASERGEDMPIILGGGPCVYNPEPLAPFFDAFCIGESEEHLVEILAAYQAARARGVSRAEILEDLAAIEGTYVPAVHDPAKVLIRKRVIADFDALPVIKKPIVPFAEIAHDRLTVEILRGCTRGCRFCQAGMTYRPVRERHADSIVSAVVEGLACTGYDEVSLTSLSSTDHSQIAEIIRRLNNCLEKTGTRLSLPSQRLDSFGVEMALLVAGGERKSGLTFAPEAGTQRLRDIINKNVTEADLVDAIRSAYGAGWRRCKLYFMIGLPGETDEDVRGIAHLANLAYRTAKDAVPDNQRANCRLSVSVAVFIPKAHTPFQWCGQIAREELQRRITLLRNSGLHRGIDLHWHDPASSLIETVFSRGGRELAPLLVGAWQNGARFDAWSEQFRLSYWLEAAAAIGLDLDATAQRFIALDEVLPWDHISCGVDKEYLKQEYGRALDNLSTPDCSFESCAACGVCPSLEVQTRLGGPRRE